MNILIASCHYIFFSFWVLAITIFIAVATSTSILQANNIIERTHHYSIITDKSTSCTIKSSVLECTGTATLKRIK